MATRRVTFRAETRDDFIESLWNGGTGVRGAIANDQPTDIGRMDAVKRNRGLVALREAIGLRKQRARVINNSYDAAA